MSGVALSKRRVCDKGERDYDHDSQDESDDGFHFGTPAS